MGFCSPKPVARIDFDDHTEAGAEGSGPSPGPVKATPVAEAWRRRSCSNAKKRSAGRTSRRALLGTSAARALAGATRPRPMTHRQGCWGVGGQLLLSGARLARRGLAVAGSVLRGVFWGALAFFSSSVPLLPFFPPALLSFGSALALVARVVPIKLTSLPVGAPVFRMRTPLMGQCPTAVPLQ